MKRSGPRVASFSAIAAIAAIALAFAAPAVHAQPITLRLAQLTRADNPQGLAAIAMKERLEQLTKGNLKLELYHGSALGGELELLSQVRLGTLDLSIMGTGLIANIEPAFSVTELPYIWKDAQSATKVLSGPIGKELFGLLDQKGVKGLAFGALGYRGFLVKRNAIENPESFKGMKIRVVENQVFVLLVKAFGANPVPMAFPEIYTALQQGTIDGVETNYYGFPLGKFQEVAKHLAVTDHIYTAAVIVMNEKKFKALSPENQAAILEAAEVGGKVMREAADKSNQDAIAELVKGGVVPVRPDRAAFEARVKPVYDYFELRVGRDLIDRVKAAQK